MQEKSLYAAEFYEKRGAILQSMGSYEEALQESQEGRKMKQSIVGEDSYYTAESYDLLASISFAQENYHEAFLFARKGIAILEKLGNHPSLLKADNYQMLAKISSFLEKHQEQVNYLQKELILRKAIHRSIFDSSWDEENPRQEAGIPVKSQIDAQENKQDLRDLRREENCLNIRKLTQFLEATRNALKELQSTRMIEEGIEEIHMPLCVIT